MTTDTPPGSWPAAEDDGGGDEVSRPSTMETYVTIEESKEPGRQRDNVAGDRTGATGKKGIARMPELPPEIRETYDCILMSCWTTVTAMERVR